CFFFSLAALAVFWADWHFSNFVAVQTWSSSTFSVPTYPFSVSLVQLLSRFRSVTILELVLGYATQNLVSSFNEGITSLKIPLSWFSFTAKIKAKSSFLALNNGVMFFANDNLLNCFSMEEGKP